MNFKINRINSRIINKIYINFCLGSYNEGEGVKDCSLFVGHFINMIKNKNFVNCVIGEHMPYAPMMRTCSIVGLSENVDFVLWILVLRLDNQTD